VDGTQQVRRQCHLLGQFMNRHPAVGAGKHNMVSKNPYVFSRSFTRDDFKDKVVIGLDLPKGKKRLRVKGFFGDGTTLFDTFSKTYIIVKNGEVELDNNFDIALLELAQK